MQKAKRNYMIEVFLGRECSEILLCHYVESLTHTQSILPTPPCPFHPSTPQSGPFTASSDPPAPLQQPLTSSTLSQRLGGPHVPWDGQEPLANRNIQDREAQEEKCFQRAQDKMWSLGDNDNPQPHSMQD